MLKSKRQRLIDLLANLGLGSAAQKSQIKAFQHYYNMNTPKPGQMLVAVDEIMLLGLASVSTVLVVFLERKNGPRINMSFNAFGGIICWRAAPDQKLTGDAWDIGWDINHPIDPTFRAKYPVNWVLCGHIGYIDDTGVRHYRAIDSYKDVLVPWVPVTKVTVPVFAKLRAEGKIKMENGKIYQRVKT